MVVTQNDEDASRERSSGGTSDYLYRERVPDGHAATQADGPTGPSVSEYRTCSDGHFLADARGLPDINKDSGGKR